MTGEVDNEAVPDTNASRSEYVHSGEITYELKMKNHNLNLLEWMMPAHEIESKIRGPSSMGRPQPGLGMLLVL